MIKEGDKVICIKDFVYQGYHANMLHYTEGKLYEISRYDKKDKTVRVLSDEGEQGVWFKIIVVHEQSEIKVFIGNTFILMADYREQQIKSVLDE
jgi:hypothetical protein